MDNLRLAGVILSIVLSAIGAVMNNAQIVGAGAAALGVVVLAS
jgi:hypothetical protein